MYHHINGLVLKKIEKADLFWMKELKDESWFGTHQVSILNIDDQLSWFENIQKTNKILILKVLVQKQNIGLFKLNNVDYINRSCDVGWDVRHQYRGKRYGKRIVEAGVGFCFEILNMNRLNAEILTTNSASKKCAESNGFIKEGCKKKAVLRCNRAIDSNVYGIIFEDWRKKLSRYKDKVCNVTFLID
jgi:RimJ/RimL family protein N-acetyltransferase